MMTWTTLNQNCSLQTIRHSPFQSGKLLSTQTDLRLENQRVPVAEEAMVDVSGGLFEYTRTEDIEQMDATIETHPNCSAQTDLRLESQHVPVAEEAMVDVSGGLFEYTRTEDIEQMDTTIETQPKDMESSGVWLAPYLGMEFATLDEAWLYWRNYGGSVGFGVRKRSGKKGKDEVYTSYTYLCQSEGLRKKDKRDHLTKIPRAETRTDCKVFLKVKLDRDCQKYKVVSYEVKHNHPLQKPEACHLVPSQREVSKVARIDIHLVDSSGIRPKETHELK